jgi:hypothetical protein
MNKAFIAATFFNSSGKTAKYANTMFDFEDENKWCSLNTVYFSFKVIYTKSVTWNSSISIDSLSVLMKLNKLNRLTTMDKNHSP